MKLSLDKETEIRAVNYPKGYERQFAKLMRDMTKAMSEQYVNNTLKKLNKGTVEKFDGSQFTDGLVVSGYYRKKVVDSYKEVKRYPEIDPDEALDMTREEYESMAWVDSVPVFKFVDSDVVTLPFSDFVRSPVEFVTDISIRDAQIGNYANIFLDLSRKVTRALMSRFSNDRLDKEVKRILTAMDKTTSQQLYNNIGGVVGIDSKVVSQQAGVTPQMNALIAESQEWVKRLRDENLALFQNATLRTMALGEGMPEIIKQYKELTKNRVNRAEFTARQQAATFNNMSQRVRAQKLGIKEGVWQTAMDERVRPSHQDRQGKTYDVQVGLYSSVDQKTLKTGEDYNCRCVTRFIIPGINDDAEVNDD